MCINDDAATDDHHYNSDHHHDRARHDVRHLALDGKRGELSDGTALFPNGDPLVAGVLAVFPGACV